MRADDPSTTGTSSRSRFAEVLLCACCLLFGSGHIFGQQGNETNRLEQIAALNSEMNQAIEKVKAIVNQPVTRLVRQRGMKVGRFTPGWFHEGASRPDYDNVDVRSTQQFIYDEYPYVTSDLNPGFVFISRQLEFNSNTKYFYVDRSLPKKRLSEAEMVEINRLYRIIGECERRLIALQPPTVPPETVTPAKTGFEVNFSQVPKSNYVKGGIAVGVVLVLYLIYRIVRPAAR